MGRRSEYFRDNFKSFWHVCSTTLFYFINFYRYAFLKSETSFSIFFSKVYGGNLRIQFKCRTHKSDYLGCTWKFFLIISLFFTFQDVKFQSNDCSRPFKLIGKLWTNNQIKLNDYSAVVYLKIWLVYWKMVWNGALKPIF